MDEKAKLLIDVFDGKSYQSLDEANGFIISKQDLAEI